MPEAEETIARVERAQRERPVERRARRGSLAAPEPPARNLIIMTREPRAHPPRADPPHGLGLETVEDAGDLLTAMKGVARDVATVPAVAKHRPIDEHEAVAREQAVAIVHVRVDREAGLEVAGRRDRTSTEQRRLKVHGKTAEDVVHCQLSAGTAAGQLGRDEPAVVVHADA